MSLVRVIIATTQTPVSVQRITEEDPVVNSVVCLSGKAMALPISAAYDAFVRDPTGVIQRHFGHPAFRIDVSDKIDEGFSWQLGLFTAHALHSAGRLAQQDQKSLRTVITTGEVDRDLNVLGVSGNAEKTAVLREKIDDFIRSGHPVTVVVPKDNADHWQSALSDIKTASSENFEILVIDTVGELLDHLGIPLSGNQNQKIQSNTQKPAPKKSSWAAAALVLLIGAGAIASNSSYRPEIEAFANKWLKSAKNLVAPAQPETTMDVPPKPTAQKPIVSVAEKPVSNKPIADESVFDKTLPEIPVTQEPVPNVPKKLPEKPAEQARLEIPAPQKKPMPPSAPVLPPESTQPEKDILAAVRPPAPIAAPLKIQVSELRAPLGFTCAESRQMKISSQIRPANLTNKIAQYGKANDKLCSIEILATAAANNNYVFGRYQRWTQGRPRQSDPDKVIDLGPRMGPVSWSVDIPNQLPRPAVFQVLILSSNTSFEISQQTYRQLDEIRPGTDVLRKMRARLQKSGIKLTSKRFRIIPDRTRSNNRPAASATTASGNTWKSTPPSPPPPR